jgi:hypothetical protein
VNLFLKGTELTTIKEKEIQKNINLINNRLKKHLTPAHLRGILYYEKDSSRLKNCTLVKRLATNMALSG